MISRIILGFQRHDIIKAGATLYVDMASEPYDGSTCQASELKSRDYLPCSCPLSLSGVLSGELHVLTPGYFCDQRVVL